MPFGPYEDFADCVRQNQDKDNPEAYCSYLQELLKDADDAPDSDDTADEASEVVTMADTVEDFHSLLVVEGVWTGDGRWIDEYALTWRSLPLPLMGLDKTTEAHMEARLIGNITRIERVGRELHGYGSFVQSDDSDIVNLQNLVRNGELRGVSVDLDAVEYEVLIDQPSEPSMDDDGTVVMEGDDWRMRITSARLMGATVVPFPAFEEAFIESLPVLMASLAEESTASGWITAMQTYDDIDFAPSQGAREEAERGLEWRREYGRGGTEVGVARARDIANGKNLSPDTVNRMLSYFARHEVDKQGEGWSPGEDGFPSAGRIAWALWGGDAGWAWARKIKSQMDSRDRRGSIVASGHPIEPPVVPPSSWFDNPLLDGPTPLTVTDDGHIFGHLAVWGQCHVGFGATCVTPPSSATNYAHFLTGEILCDDGTRIPVGQVTLGTTHASHKANADQTARHYDHTGLAAADVMAGEDEFGIWIAGALRPHLEPATVRELMGADVSGDWRRIGGNLELVAVLSVNVPGFPKIRVREAEGLVASLSLSAFSGEDREPDLSGAAERIARTIGRDSEARLREALAKVRPDSVD
jgi:hypothetical protein